MELKETILELISTHREDSYWDFKRQPHTNLSDLAHDIICMANSLVDSDKYLILGVSDPSEGCEIIGVPENRKKQCDYIDFVRCLPFAGDIRPEVELHEITIDDKLIDVLVIFERKNKPYYLVNDYQGVKANYIYTRIGDTNTPKTSSADLFFIEKMWRQRFHLDVNPLEKFKLILDDKINWILDIGNKAVGYYAPSPEYQIVFGEPRAGWEVYSHFFINPSSFFGEAEFKFHTTTLFTLPYGYVDEMRIPIAIPKIESIGFDGPLFYYYYQKDTVLYQFMNLIGLPNLFHGRKPGKVPFIFFDNESERKLFNEYITSLPDYPTQAINNEWGKSIAAHIKHDKGDYDKRACFIAFAVEKYGEWKSMESE
jgi:hypothetical protein